MAPDRPTAQTIFPPSGTPSDPPHPSGRPDPTLRSSGLFRRLNSSRSTRPQQAQAEPPAGTGTVRSDQTLVDGSSEGRGESPDRRLAESRDVPSPLGQAGTAPTGAGGTVVLQRRPTLRDRVSDGIKQVRTFGGTILRPAPTSPDGRYASEDQPVSALDDPAPSTTLLRDLWSQFRQGRLGKDGHALVQVVASLRGQVDDRDMMLENLVEMLASMETNSTLQTNLSQSFLTTLYNDLPHPPANLIGPAYRFRTVDGSLNNPWSPEVGKAGLPYARTVTPERPGLKWLPDPGAVFDAVLKRDQFRPHPSGISSLLFAFATLIVHTLFRTKRGDPSINETSSYLDLSVLYGHDEEHAKRVRTGKNGLIHNDTFAEPRLLNFPPAVTALLVIFSRNHNFVAEKLLQINEHNAFAPWESLSEEKQVWQDNELFQTARLVNCGFFINVVLHDYLRSILGLVGTDSTWTLDPRVEIRGLLQGQIPRGTGNHSSIEFSCLYSWHSSLSQADEKWITERMERIFEGQDLATITPAQFGQAVAKEEAKMGKDPQKWTVPGLQRGADGKFADEDLAKILLDATEEVAGSFGAQHNPAALRVIDTMRIATARSTWRTCTLNEFRKFLNLKPFTKFTEHNSNPAVASAMERCYVHPDNIELYTGLLAEQAKPSIVGSGLCPGYTISRAILSDAVALTRGDRFFTTNFDRTALSSWGFEDCQSNPSNGAYGGVLGKLLMRNLPRAYRLNSVHALFPFQIPGVMATHLSKLKVSDQYDFSRPVYAHGWRSVTDREAVKTVLSTPDTFGVVYSAAIRSISSKDYGFMLGFDDVKRHDIDRALMDGTVFPEGYIDDFTKFYTDTIDGLIRENSWPQTGTVRNLDFVRDCSTMASVYWVARTFGIPLKLNKKGYEHGLLTPQELYLMLTGMFVYVFILPLGDPSIGWQLRDTSLKSSKLLCAIVEARLKGRKYIPEGLLGGRPGTLLNPGEPAQQFYGRMLKSGRPINELVSNCMGIMVASTSNQGELAAHTLNLFLQPEHKKSYDELVALANNGAAPTDQKINDKIRAYVWEAMRLDPQTPAVPRVCLKKTQVVDGGKTLDFEQGDFVLGSLTTANMDPDLFPNPTTVDVTRNPSDYRVFGFGMHTCLGAKIVNVAQPIILRAAFRLKNLRRAPGPSGQLYRFAQDLAGLSVWTYVDAQSNAWPFPVAMSVQYDVPSPK